MTAITQTVIIWDGMGEKDLGWRVVEGDHSQLDRKYMNAIDTSDDDCDTLFCLMFESSGELRTLNHDFNAMPHGEGTKIIVAGSLP